MRCWITVANTAAATYALSAYQTDSGCTVEPEMVNHPDVYTVIEPLNSETPRSRQDDRQAAGQERAERLWRHKGRHADRMW